MERAMKKKSINILLIGMMIFAMLVMQACVFGRQSGNSEADESIPLTDVADALQSTDTSGQNSSIEDIDPVESSGSEAEEMSGEDVFSEEDNDNGNQFSANSGNDEKADGNSTSGNALNEATKAASADKENIKTTAAANESKNAGAKPAQTQPGTTKPAQTTTQAPKPTQPQTQAPKPTQPQETHPATVDNGSVILPDDIF